MAATIGTATAKVLRLKFEDFQGEIATKVTELDGAADDTDIEGLLVNLDGVMNAFARKATMSSLVEITGMDSAAENAIERNVSNILELTFTKVNPINALETVTKTFAIPAYKAALQDTDNSILIADTAGTGSLPARLRGITDFLEDNLDYVGGDGAHYPGGWTWSRAQSGFVSVSNVIDGQ